MGFDKYVFVEKKDAKFRELQKLREEYPHLSHDITLYQGEANHYLQEVICKNLKQNKLHRAVVFLDPYGMEVEWATIETLAETQVVDLWLLFPLGVAVNRFLRRDAEIAPADRARLTRLFGTNNWFEAFYQKPAQLSFFEDETRLEKVGDFDTISEYFVKRLQSVFGSDGVAKNPLRLYNSTGVPIYLLCFAASNPKGKSIALKIAEHILK